MLAKHFRSRQGAQFSNLPVFCRSLGCASSARIRLVRHQVGCAAPTALAAHQSCLATNQECHQRGRVSKASLAVLSFVWSFPSRSDPNGFRHHRPAGLAPLQLFPASNQLARVPATLKQTLDPGACSRASLLNPSRRGDSLRLCKRLVFVLVPLGPHIYSLGSRLRPRRGLRFEPVIPLRVTQTSAWMGASSLLAIAVVSASCRYPFPQPHSAYLLPAARRQ